MPASIDRDRRRRRSATRELQINLSESLGGVPGLLARDRQNYAQDVQISVRGFGARSTFGIRGVRLYVDGIPATLPDGQGQLSNVDLGSADRIEVLRGPFSALYGNSSGGVIQVFTEDGASPSTFTTALTGGSDSTVRLGIKASGASGSFGYVVSASEFSTDGYRDHSATERRLGNAKLTWQPDEASKLTLVANSVALPKAQDPLGLTRAQFEADPRGVDPSALAFDTRKTVDQTQLGVVYERRLDEAQSVRAARSTAASATPSSSRRSRSARRRSPLHPGGVIVARPRLHRHRPALDPEDAGSATGPSPWSAASPTTRWRSTARATRTSSARRSACRARCGATRDNDVSNFDQYLQGSWRIRQRWTVDAGVRHSSVRFKSDDSYIVGAESRRQRQRAATARRCRWSGLMFAASDSVHLYATVGRGFETPTLNELAYRPSGETGLNLDLKASRSDSIEVGVKTRLGAGRRVRRRGCSRPAPKTRS